MENTKNGFTKIGAPAQRALARAGVESLEQLSHFSEAEIAKLHGMGPKALGILREALAANGLGFAQKENFSNPDF